MKSKKDRLHRVLVVGATPAGIAATNKLGEMGIPVTLVDAEPDLDRKLADERWRLDSGVLMNYAHRPGLIRILRNPKIRCIVPGRIAGLKHTPQGFSAHIESDATFVDPARCTLCGRCAEVCPVTDRDGGKAVKMHGRQSLPGRPVIDKRKQPLCQENCPLGVNVQGYVALARVGKYAEALELIRRDNVLPGICGRICTHPCESACRRGDLDEPLAIRDIKRFLADYENGSGTAAKTAPPAPTRPQRIAVVGSGPAGLAAAADLARHGYAVTVIEKDERPGGILRHGIGEHRLPRNVLDREIAAIGAMGVRFETGRPVDFSKDIKKLKKEYDAVVVSSGLGRDRFLGVPGEDLEGVEGCLAVLGKLNRGELRELREHIAVVGDGNAAYDLARSLVRIGARVTIVSWFPESMIPADPHEVRSAAEEGIALVDRSQVTAFAGTNGRFDRLVCVPTVPGKPDAKGIAWPVPDPAGSPFELAFDRAVVAIGQVADRALLESCGFDLAQNGCILLDDAFDSGANGLYAAGDVTSGASTVVKAMASGRRAAGTVHAALSGEEAPEPATVRPCNKDFCTITPDIPSLARVDMPERQPAARKENFAEVALGFSETQVQAEASRCLQCGVCSECFQCAEACSAIGAVQHADPGFETMEHAGVLIIADPDAAPGVKGEDVIRAYSAKGARDDVYALMLRGFAAAAEAMLLLGGSSLRLKGHGMAFSPPAPQLSDDVQVGVFACRCNDSFGWDPAIDAYVEGLSDRPEVRHAEVLPSCCTPEAAASIVRTIRAKGLTRVVLASCVCCPLDFICGACTDQRSRLKDALFHGTGISRAMVETCNARGEVLRILKEDPALAVSRFTGLIDRSIGRTHFLKTLPAPARPYNFTTAVIGDSEAAEKSVQVLADAGMEVFWFGGPDTPLAHRAPHPNVHVFEGSTVSALRGTVGNFQVTAETEENQQVFQAGAVILDEQVRRRIAYTPDAPFHAKRIDASMQRCGQNGAPFYSPGASSVPGLFIANPSGIKVSERIKGTSAAIQAVSVMPRSPRQNKGYTVVVDERRCRACGRCMEVCPYQAVSFRENAIGGWRATVDEALCKGCGSCISVCPSNAADSPYRDRRYLEQMIEEILL